MVDQGRLQNMHPPYLPGIMPSYFFLYPQKWQLPSKEDFRTSVTQLGICNSL